MAYVLCEVHPGLGKRDVSVAVHDVHKVRTFLHVDRDFLTRERDRVYLPVGVVSRDHGRGMALIELPQEADSGAHRLWVPLSSLLEANGAPA
ncbi:MAG TPA: hypothetical protein VMG10_06850 [Gemmataceae bacterium]|nr:hypothetical protein [Gemmataceae bacterium]